MESFKIFVVEDDVFYGQLLKRHLALNPDNEVIHFENGRDCLQNMHLKPSMISLDYRLPDISGMEVLKKLSEDYSHVPVIVVSGQEDISTAVNLLKKGAYDYYIKDDNTKDRLWNAAVKIKENRSLQNQLDELKTEIVKKYEFGKIIKGNSRAIKTIFSLMEKAAKSNITVSVSGETGTGKELVAKAIHYNSPQRKNNFVGINVSAIPRDLIESEMFGHEKGAFTSASDRRIGKVELSQGGTLFLDEIESMPTDIQIKLLRTLQERVIERVGSNQLIPVDFRIIAATKINLREAVSQGTFREDLFYRLNVARVPIPALRERNHDILLLLHYFMNQLAEKYRVPIPQISEKIQQSLIHYSWPGNIRELRNITQQLLLNLPLDLSPDGRLETPAIEEGDGLDKQLQNFEKHLIIKALENNHWRIEKTAEALNIPRKKLYLRMKKFNLQQ
jgi:DNA-binding NtrC family response regulator